eukprot:473836_1
MDGNHGIEANNAVQELVDAGLTIEKATLAVTMSQDSNNHDRNNEVISRMISLMRDADISANDAMIVAAMDLGIEYESTENIIGHMEMSDEMEECFMNNGFTKQESFNALLNTGCGIEESLEMLIYHSSEPIPSINVRHHVLSSPATLPQDWKTYYLDNSG